MKIRIKKSYKLWYWFLVLIIFLAQVFFTLHSLNRIRLEELAESVRNVFWLQNRYIYDGISSNVGWYGTLMIIYNLFGFSLFSAKYYRLGLHLISLLCLSKLLKKYVGEKKAILPLVTIGLSPTLLYFNSLQTSFGTDLQYFPICLYLLLSLDFSKYFSTLLKQFLLWFITMTASMSYPSFLPYISIIGIIYIVHLFKEKLPKKKIIMNILISLLGFLLPILIILIYVHNPQNLIFDSKVNSGIFRGGGKIPNSILLITENVSFGTKIVLRDLFNFPGSFYFEADIVRSEFSHKVLYLGAIFLLLTSFWIFIKVKKSRVALLLTLILALTSLFIGNMSGDLPGIRRSTAFLASTYGFFIIIWKFTNRKHFGNLLTALITVLLILFPLHHLKAYFNNIKALSLPSPHAADACFNKIPNNPPRSLEKYVNQARKGEILNNNAEDDGTTVCRLHAIYAAAGGSCFWNHLNCPPIWGYDENTRGFILLSPLLWNTYYFNH